MNRALKLVVRSGQRGGESARVAEKALLPRLCSGDQEAWFEFVTQHRRALYRILIRILRDTTKADDALQEVFLKAFRGIAKFRGECRFITWLRQLAVHTALDMCDPHRRYPPRLESLDATEVDRAADTPSVLDAVAGREGHARVRREVESLDFRYRIVLVLRDYDERPYDEIATILCLSESRVRAIRSEAIALLRQRLSDEMP